MAAEPTRRRRQRWPAGAAVVAAALILATIVLGVLGGGKPDSSTVPTTLGFPKGVPSAPAPPRGFAQTVRTPTTPAGAAGRSGGGAKRCHHGGPCSQRRETFGPR